MSHLSLSILYVKYALAGLLVLAVWLFPAWLARQNGISGLQMAMVRFGSWWFGWTGLGWLLGLYWAVKK